MLTVVFDDNGWTRRIRAKAFWKLGENKIEVLGVVNSGAAYSYFYYPTSSIVIEVSNV